MRNDLSVQQYLRSGKTLESLKENFGIKYQEDEDLVILSYHQIDSPKTDPIVMECRGLVLEKGSWNIVSFPFVRFFNYGEALEFTKDFNFQRAKVSEKVDGSLIHMSFYKEEWRIFTRGTIDASGRIGEAEKTFKQLFMQTIEEDLSISYESFLDRLTTDYNYIFELCTPENKVIKQYDDYTLYLLAFRNKEHYFKEFSNLSLVLEAESIGVRYPNFYDFSSYNEIKDFMDEISSTDEGFVCVDYNLEKDSFDRVKVKNPLYMAIATMKQSANSDRALLMLIMKNEQDEFMTYFPEYKDRILFLGNRYNSFVKAIYNDIEKLQPLFGPDKKAYAMIAKDSTHPAFMFERYKRYINTEPDTIITYGKENVKDGTTVETIKYIVENFSFTWNEYVKQMQYSDSFIDNILKRLGSNG